MLQRSINASGNVVFIDKDKNKFFFKKFTYNELTQKGTGTDVKAKTSDGSYLQSKSGKLDNKNKIVELIMASSHHVQKLQMKENSVLHGHLKVRKLFMITKTKLLLINMHFLKLKKLPILYTPYISHPDPSVKKKKWFSAASNQNN